MNVALVKPTTDHALGELFAAAQSRLPGSGTVAEVRQMRFEDVDL